MVIIHAGGRRDNEQMADRGGVGGDMMPEPTWRDTFLRRFGPGFLGGLRFNDWIRLLRENRFQIAPASFPRAMAIACQGAQNSLFGWFEELRHASCAKDARIAPRLFILGHWRSGTTHLHNLLTIDQLFAYPNNYQVLFPHTFLTTEPLHSRIFDWFLPRHRPMDNIEWTMRSPQEEEFALAILTGMSPCMGIPFPRRWDHYQRYLTFRDVDVDEIEIWKTAFQIFLKRVTWKLQRPLILKSPPHTCRIRLLLELFPEAKFIHIRRNPFDVFQSTRKMLIANFRMHGLHGPDLANLDEWILRQYRTMYEVYFEERDLIPASRLHELSFEALEQDPLLQLQQIYNSLDLPDFTSAEPSLIDYITSIKGYQKNTFPALPADLRNRISQEWRHCFEQWGYPG